MSCAPVTVISDTASTEICFEEIGMSHQHLEAIMRKGRYPGITT